MLPLIKKLLAEQVTQVVALLQNVQLVIFVAIHCIDVESAHEFYEDEQSEEQTFSSKLK